MIEAYIEILKLLWLYLFFFLWTRTRLHNWNIIQNIFYIVPFVFVVNYLPGKIIFH
jgi:hypothetical protein